MAHPSNSDKRSSKKRVIEFDMFVHDLEPSEEEKIKGGSDPRSRDKGAEETNKQHHTGD
jgi:hypothetical protein